uniref:Fibrinogen C-terminal domain-containing protein n=1 Tax=Leptobrachium leishanense TaxID=445787 RepID=A0A8C5P9Q7_9ANUR
MDLALVYVVLWGCVIGVGSWGMSSEKKVQFASWDEVNVLAHGLLQLGHGLKEHVDKTKSQLKEITGKMSQQNASLMDLLKQAKEIRENGEMLKSRMLELEDNEKELHDFSQRLRDKMLEISSGRQQLNQRLESIEDNLQQMEPVKRQNRSDKECRSIQSLMETQNQRINELLEKIKMQQTKLDKQNQQIKKLQTKIHSDQMESHKQRLNLQNVSTELQSNTTAETGVKCLPSDCHEIFLKGQKSSGIFKIKPLLARPFEVLCEITAEVGWTVIQRRRDGSVNFDQLWESYKTGFGTLNGEFWLGLEKMYQISEQGQYLMHIELQDWEQNTKYMEAMFHLGGPSTAYNLQIIGQVKGDLENALSDFRQQAFSTRDRDHDLKSHVNCAKHLSGGWWFSTCGHSNLNGKYFHSIPRQRHERKQGIYWKNWKGRYYPLKSTSIKIRPFGFKATE